MACFVVNFKVLHNHMILADNYFMYVHSFTVSVLINECKLYGNFTVERKHNSNCSTTTEIKIEKILLAHIWKDFNRKISVRCNEHMQVPHF